MGKKETVEEKRTIPVTTDTIPLIEMLYGFMGSSPKNGNVLVDVLGADVHNAIISAYRSLNIGTRSPIRNISVNQYEDGYDHVDILIENKETWHKHNLVLQNENGETEKFEILPLINEYKKLKAVSNLHTLAGNNVDDMYNKYQLLNNISIITERSFSNTKQIKYVLDATNPNFSKLIAINFGEQDYENNKFNNNPYSALKRTSAVNLRDLVDAYKRVPELEDELHEACSNMNRSWEVIKQNNLTQHDTISLFDFINIIKKEQIDQDTLLKLVQLFANFNDFMWYTSDGMYHISKKRFKIDKNDNGSLELKTLDTKVYYNNTWYDLNEFVMLAEKDKAKLLKLTKKCEELKLICNAAYGTGMVGNLKLPKECIAYRKDFYKKMQKELDRLSDGKVKDAISEVIKIGEKMQKDPNDINIHIAAAVAAEKVSNAICEEDLKNKRMRFIEKLHPHTEEEANKYNALFDAFMDLYNGDNDEEI